MVLQGNSLFVFPSSRLFGGLILDVKRKAPWFWSDFRDGLSLQCLASFLFLFCACMSPVITFGGLLGEATDGHIVSSSLGWRGGAQNSCKIFAAVNLLWVFSSFSH